MDNEIREKLESIRARMPISRERLDEECVYQAAFYAEVGDFVSQLKHEARQAKDRADFVAADLRDKARKNPGSFGISKVTIDAIEDAVVIHPEYQKASKFYLDTQYLADCASVLLAAAEQRKSMVKDAVSLFVHEYYSTKQDLTPERKVMSTVGEQDIVELRRKNAAQRQEETQGEELNE